ncbi:uncharacterized protein LOC114297478 [Camellia sinensis]|uniref:uncharacterized protein LOC114297478 n=1 Tax=Camellia sinensis TaxID=4442 RepID=UPI001036C44A|nr:uncharacterized protein LOC114297478 [Camellia sinensis]
MGLLARELASVLQESMNILRAKETARAAVGETTSSSMANEFFKSNPMEFYGSANPLLADRWLEQIVKTFEVFHIVDDELQVTLRAFQLKGDTGQWWRYAKDHIVHTWEAFTHAYQKKYLPSTARERLRRQLEELE